ncbi:MAG: hypothetical protein IKY83_08245, partial [Proteobacteria bacterium]|nr:hypothetical protein [Pseudomonadota bacterium]
MKRGLICMLAILLASTNAFAQNTADPADPNAGAAAESTEDAAQAPASIYDDASLKPRDIYNLAVQKLGANDFALAIEGLSRARDLAAYDNELRYSSAYNLGFAYAKRAEAAGDMNALDMNALQAVIDDLNMSIAWFRDAVRQRPSLTEAKGNLEITLKRQLMAKDILAQKYNTLEHQLDALIQTERGIRENSRSLSERIQAANASRDPLTFQEDFKTLAKLQRQAITDANQTAENLAHAISAIESKQESERTQEEAFKLFQLQSASPLLDNARQAMASARRQLRELSMSEALRLTNKAFNALKQAREQLADPLSVIGHILEDETNFVRIASAKHMFETPELLAAYKAQLQQDDLAAPPWLTADLLNDEQTDAMLRTNRVSAFLKAMVEAAAQQPDNAQGQDPRQAEAATEQVEQIKDALPLIDEAADAMQRVTQAIEQNNTKDTVEQGSLAVEKLALAMERFADLKHLIEIAYASQESLDPVIRGELEGKEELLTREQQRQILKPVLEKNVDRLERLSTLLAKESAKMNQQAMQGAQNGQQISEEQQQQMQQLFETAEMLRNQAKEADERLVQKLSEAHAEDIDETAVPTSISDATWGELSGDAETAKQSLEQLRILFFTVIEHIQELLKQQTATLDKTTDVSTGEASEIEMKLPPVIDRERMHELTAEKLSEVLTKQAESMQNQPPQQGGQNPAEMAKRYTEAASELQVAATAMRQAQSDLQNENRLFTESIEQQNTAIEHIQKALELLQPPQQQQQQ